LPSNLKAPEVAAELFVSTDTIRTHPRHICARLGTHGRAEAGGQLAHLDPAPPMNQRLP
jgi:DNA-binding NarL/FixJ family response regulator